MNRKSLYFTSPGQVEIREEVLGRPQAGEVQVETIYSCISAGTELLLYRGELPPSMPADPTLSSLKGKLSYPLKYGYSAVGKVVDIGPEVTADLKGSMVFAFNPHESAFNARVTDIFLLPAKIDPQDAVFLANMETAVNLILDGSPRLGERVAVIGQGIVGLLLAALLSHHPLDVFFTFDKYPSRRQRSEKSGASHSFDPDEVDRALQILGQRRADLVYELSGNPDALNMALSLVGNEGRIVVGSWYGEKRAPINLGGIFHRGRVKIVSSQVSHIAPALTGRWDRARRFEQVWKWLAKLQPSQFVTHRFRVANAADAYALLADKPSDALGVVLTYNADSDF